MFEKLLRLKQREQVRRRVHRSSHGPYILRKVYIKIFLNWNKQLDRIDVFRSHPEKLDPGTWGLDTSLKSLEHLNLPFFFSVQIK